MLTDEFKGCSKCQSSIGIGIKRAIMQVMSKRLGRRILPLALMGCLAVAAPALGQGLAGPYLAAQQAEMRGDVAAAATYFGKALARDPGNTTIMERAMLHKIAAGDISEGIAIARRFEEISPGHHLGVLALASDAMRNGDLARARQMLRNGGPFVGQVMDAWASYGDGQKEAAYERLREIEASNVHGAAGKTVAAMHLGLMQAADGDDEAALVSFERAAGASDGGTLRLARARAGALARLGRQDEAVQSINARLAGTYGNIPLSLLAERIAGGEVPAVRTANAEQGAADALHEVARMLARGQNRLISLAYARLAVHLDSGLTDAQLLVAQILDAGQQYEVAIEAYDAIPDDAPEALNAQVGKAEVLSEAGKPDEGIAAMRETLAQFPDALEIHTALGDMLRRESRFEEAASAYDGAVALLPKIEPHHWALFYQRGIAHERSKQWDKAEADFRRALELEPDQPDVLNYLGYSLVELGQKLSEAEEMIEKAVKQRPDDGYIVDSLGWVLYRFGEFDRAVEHLERAVELRPTDPVINDHFGDALWQVGRKTEARFQWKRALSFEPEDKDAERIRRKLDVGLDVVLAEEEAEGLPGIFGRQSENGVTEQNKDGG
jgi:tetratricopeptide (TPR) repeat protein